MARFVAGRKAPARGVRNAPDPVAELVEINARRDATRSRELRKLVEDFERAARGDEFRGGDHPICSTAASLRYRAAKRALFEALGLGTPKFQSSAMPLQQLADFEEGNERDYVDDLDEYTVRLCCADADDVLGPPSKRMAARVAEARRAGR